MLMKFSGNLQISLGDLVKFGSDRINGVFLVLHVRSRGLLLVPYKKTEADTDVS